MHFDAPVKSTVGLAAMSDKDNVRNDEREEDDDDTVVRCEQAG